MNEIDFRIDCERNRSIITLNATKSLKMTNSNNREYVIVVKSINDEDETIPFMLITQEVDFVLHRVIVDNDLHRNITLTSQEIKYINDDLTID